MYPKPVVVVFVVVTTFVILVIIICKKLFPKIIKVCSVDDNVH